MTATGYTISDEERERRRQRMLALNTGQKLPTAEEIAAIPHRRFSLADLEPFGLWLLDRLKGAYPHLDQRNFPGWLRGCMEGREYCFIRTDGCVGLAVIRNEPLQPQGDVHVLFAFRKDGSLAELGAIYGEIYRWAAMQGANRLYVEGENDGGKDFIIHVLGRYNVQKTAYVMVG